VPYKWRSRRAGRNLSQPIIFSLSLTPLSHSPHRLSLFIQPQNPSPILSPVSSSSPLPNSRYYNFFNSRVRDFLLFSFHHFSFPYTHSPSLHSLLTWAHRHRFTLHGGHGRRCRCRHCRRRSRCLAPDADSVPQRVARCR